MSADTNPFGSPGSSKSTVFEYELPPEGEESSFYVKPGTYIARVSDIEAKESKSSGKPMWVVKFDIVQEFIEKDQKAQYANADEVAGKTLSLFLTTSKSMAWKIRPAMAALGMIGPDNRTIRFESKDIIGKGAVIKVIDSDFNPERKSSSVDDVKPLPQGFVMPKPSGVPF